MSYRLYFVNGQRLDAAGWERSGRQAEPVRAAGRKPGRKPAWTGVIVDKKRDEMPRKALLPKLVWPDVQPSLRSRLMDHLILLTGRRKWWASAAVVQERARRLALRAAPHRAGRWGREV